MQLRNNWQPNLNGPVIDLNNTDLPGIKNGVVMKSLIRLSKKGDSVQIMDKLLAS